MNARRRLHTMLIQPVTVLLCLISLAFPARADSNEVTVLEEDFNDAPLRVTGKVIDAENGEPLPAFNMIIGLSINTGDRPHWLQQAAKPCTDGAFETRFGSPPKNSGIPPSQYYVCIVAEGYVPQASRALTMDEGEVELVFELVKPADVTGKIVNAEGEPVTDATVDLTIDHNLPNIRNGQITEDLERVKTATGDQGRFAFSPQGGDYLLLVQHDDGYAVADADDFVAANHTITLTPWITIKGRLLIGDKARAGEKVVVTMDWSHVGYYTPPEGDLSALTDEQGYFEITRIPHLPGKVGRQLQFSEGLWFVTITEPFDLEPGDTFEVNLGGAGRPVIGQYVWPEGAEAKSFQGSFAVMNGKPSARARRALAKKILPQGYYSWTPEQRQIWRDSEEGKATKTKLDEAKSQQVAELRSYEAAVDADGRFRIENVKPGVYNIHYQVYQPPSDDQHDIFDRIWYLDMRFEVDVPPLPDGLEYYDEPLDTGTHVVEVPEPTP
jgi:hypothetical protein